MKTVELTDHQIGVIKACIAFARMDFPPGNKINADIVSIYEAMEKAPWTAESALVITPSTPEPPEGKV